MLMKRFLKITAALFIILSVSGCGNEGNSNTNGTLTLTAAAPVNAGVGTADMKAVAILTSAVATRPLVGVDVTFVVTQYGFNSSSGKNEVVETYSVTTATNSLGEAVANHTFAQSQTMATTLQISASSAGLSQSVPSIVLPIFVPVVP